MTSLKKQLTVITNGNYFRVQLKPYAAGLVFLVRKKIQLVCPTLDASLMI